MDLVKRRVGSVKGEDLKHSIIAGARLDEDLVVARGGAVGEYVAE